MRERVVIVLISCLLRIPVVLGDVMWYMTLAAPAEWPMRVMLCGSPPNDSTFSRTHRRAKYWSSKPRFPLASKSSRQKNPEGRKRTVSPIKICLSPAHGVCLLWAYRLYSAMYVERI
jgi:hypothetical protein